ncbi:MAG: hypothetical protein DRQ55_01960 [Planctomycetota bacterium]|nr:MAG: hypothetical protein DRQ55_01960 [Planctomycetota bacterium]
MLLLSLLVLAVFKLVWHHEELASAADRWCQGEPTYYVQISGDEVERTLGMPAALVSSPPAALPAPPADELYDVEVLNTSQTLYPPSASANVLMTLNP